MKENDKLSLFRKPLNSESKEYLAFKASDSRQIRLLICPHLRAWEWLSYWGLQRIIINGPHGTELVVCYSFAVAVIKGRNLHSINAAIANETCFEINQFTLDRFDKPTDMSAPYIETIDIYVETRDQMVRATDEALNDMAKSRSTQGH